MTPQEEAQIEQLIEQLEEVVLYERSIQETMSARIKELEARNELLERDRPLHCRGCDGHDIDLLGDPE